MAPIRPNSPPSPLRTSTIMSGSPPVEPPSTPSRQSSTGDSLNMIVRPEHTTVPPSPGVPAPGFEAPETTSPIIGPMGMLKAQTGADVQKRSIKNITRPGLEVDTDVSGAVRARSRGSANVFRFMDLPGEIRNEIYKYMHEEQKQALLVHRPRIASLRPRTRVDRGRTLPSDVTGHEQDETLSSASIVSGSGDVKEENVPRDTNRPFWGLTQVCRQLRHEYRPIYMAKQEIGIDLTDIVNYISAFYPSAPEEIAKLTSSEKRHSDMPFVGNLTIAAGRMPNKQERSPEGIEVFPLLDIWANSVRMEAGFGRYLKGTYVPETDGEAKDLYRLFGRRVLQDRSCSDMNRLWRTILRNRSLASIRIHRAPAARSVSVPSWMIASPLRNTLVPVSTMSGVMFNIRTVTKPYIHIIFKKEAAEPWMTEFESIVPKTPDWLGQRGFGNMDYFDVKIGVEQDAAK